MNSEKPISTPRFLRRLQLVGGIVAHSDFVLPNGDEKRHSEAAIETATRRGKKTVSGSGKREAGSGKASVTAEAQRAQRKALLDRINRRASCRTQQNRHSGDIRGPVDLEKPGFRLPDWTLPGQAPPE